MMSRVWIPMLCLSVACAAACGQTTVDPDHALAWAANVGWINWDDSASISSNVLISQSFVGGWIWSENIGWISIGDGSPANGLTYENQSASDFGVNIEPSSGDLYGLAWSENAGWINFDTRVALGELGLQARLDYSSERFRGYAWSSNKGWVNLDDSEHFIGVLSPTCLCEWDDQAGAVDVFDLLAYLQDWFAGVPVADVDQSGGTNVFDLLTFLECWFPASAGQSCL